MTMVNQNIRLYCGNTENVSIPIYDDNTPPGLYSMTGAVVTWMLMTDPGATATPTLTKTFAVTTTAVTFALAKADTLALTPGRYWHEATAVFLSGDIKTLWTGWCDLEPAKSAQ
jgi:hypothetical protein